MATPARSSDDYFRTLFEACGEAFFVTNEMGQAFDCNDAATSLFGCQRDDILGTTPLDWSPPYQADGRRSDEWAAEIFARAAAGETVRFEWENFRLDHSPVFVSVTVRRAVVDGQACYMVVSRDISDQKRTEESLRRSEIRFRSYFDLPLVGIATTSLEKGWLDVNQRLCDILGYPRDELVNYTWSDITHPDDLAGDVAQFERVLSGESEGYSLDKRFIRKDGQVIHASISVRCVRNSDGAPEYFVALVQDISERKQTEQTLLQSLRDKQALLHEVHHRVKNNLQVIVSLLRLEAPRSAQPDTKAVLAEMQGRIRSMALLHESLYRTGIFASVDLGAYLRALAHQVFRGQDHSRAAIRLVVDCAPVQVSMDLATPCGLLANELIANGLKHAFPQERAGEVRISLHALQQNDAPPKRWRLQVSDNGIGLPADFEGRRAHSLGLQLAGDLCRQIGGTLEVESQPGAGATFSVTFQIPEPAAAE